MIKIRYPKPRGSYGLIECSALQLDGNHLRIVQDDGVFVTHTLFLSYDGRLLRDGPSGLDELFIETDDAHSLVVAEDSKLKPMLGGSKDSLVLLAGRDGLKLANSQGAIVTLRVTSAARRSAVSSSSGRWPTSSAKRKRAMKPKQAGKPGRVHGRRRWPSAARLTPSSSEEK
jgi:hypothetical protein